MACIAAGMAQTELILPVIGTFFAFADYMRSAIRLTCLMRLKVSIEAGIELGWHKYIGSNGIAISLSEFGECGSIADLQEHFGYTVEKILNKIKQVESEIK